MNFDISKENDDEGDDEEIEDDLSVEEGEQLSIAIRFLYT
jgi:hypothetical protein